METSKSYNTIVISLEDTKPTINMAMYYKCLSENNKTLIEHLDQLFNKYKNIIVVADTNIDLLSETDVSRMYMDMLDVNSVNIKITNVATRITLNSATLIDQVLSHLKIDRFGFDITMHDLANLDHKAISV